MFDSIQDLFKQRKQQCKLRAMAVDLFFVLGVPVL